MHECKFTSVLLTDGVAPAEVGNLESYKFPIKAHCTTSDVLRLVYSFKFQHEAKHGAFKFKA